jgi:hypothetical protein
MANAPEEDPNDLKPAPTSPWDDAPMGVDAVYKPSLEAMQETLRRAETRRRTLYKFKLGTNTFRLCPPYKRDGGLYEPIPWHWNVGSRRRGVMCRSYFGKRCFLCDTYQQLKASADPADEEEAARIKRVWRYLANVIVIGEEEKGPQVVELKERMARTLLEFAMDPEIGNFVDPVEGRNLKIEKTGTGLDTHYSEPRISTHLSPIPYEEWMPRVKHLDQFFQRPTFAQQQSMYEGAEEGGEFMKGVTWGCACDGAVPVTRHTHTVFCGPDQSFPSVGQH